MLYLKLAILPFAIMLTAIFVIVVIGTVCFLIYNKKKNISKFSKNQRFFVQSGIIMFVGGILVLAMNSGNVIKDMKEMKTETIIGTVTYVSSSVGNSYTIVIDTEATQDVNLECISNMLYEHEIRENNTYRFEYFVNSKIINEIELLEND